MKKMKVNMVLLCLVLCGLMGCGSGVKINALDYIQLGDYKGLEVTRMNTEVNEEDVQAQIDSIISAYATKEEITDRDDVREGDIANIDYQGYMDGELFDGGSAKGFDLEIGSHTFIEGFEAGLIGAKVGDNLDVNVTFPDEYVNNPNLSGKPAVFKVTVNSISKQVDPELTDELIMQATNNQYSTIDELKSYLRDQMASTLLSYADSMMYSSLLNTAIANATIKQDVPEDYINEKIEAMVRTAKSNAEAYGVSYEDYLKNYLSMDEESFQSTIRESSQDIAKQSLVVQAIADTEGISVSDEEFDNKVAEILEQYGYESKKKLLENVTERDILDSMLLDKVEEFLADNAIITIQ